MKVCSKCGAEFSDDYNFCEKCGEPLTGDSTDKKTDTSEVPHRPVRVGSASMMMETPRATGF